MIKLTDSFNFAIAFLLDLLYNDGAEQYHPKKDGTFPAFSAITGTVGMERNYGSFNYRRQRNRQNKTTH